MAPNNRHGGINGWKGRRVGSPSGLVSFQPMSVYRNVTLWIDRNLHNHNSNVMSSSLRNTHKSQRYNTTRNVILLLFIVILVMISYFYYVTTSILFNTVPDNNNYHNQDNPFLPISKGKLTTTTKVKGKDFGIDVSNVHNDYRINNNNTNNDELVTSRETNERHEKLLQPLLLSDQHIVQQLTGQDSILFVNDHNGVTAMNETAAEDGLKATVKDIVKGSDNKDLNEQLNDTQQQIQQQVQQQEQQQNGEARGTELEEFVPKRFRQKIASVMEKIQNKNRSNRSNSDNRNRDDDNNNNNNNNKAEKGDLFGHQKIDAKNIDSIQHHDLVGMNTSSRQRDASAYVTKLLDYQQQIIQLLRRQQNTSNNESNLTNYRSCRLMMLQSESLVSDNNISIHKSSIWNETLQLCQGILQESMAFHQQTNNSRFRNQTGVVYYNPLSHERYICGTIIQPHGMLLLNKPCYEPPRLFYHSNNSLTKVDDDGGRSMHKTSNERDTIMTIQERRRMSNREQPGISSKYTHYDPIVLSFEGLPINEEYAFVMNDYDQCDVPCNSYGTAMVTGNRLVESIDDRVTSTKSWSIMHSMEGDGYYPELQIDPYAWKRNTFYSTTSFRSEVPLPYYSRYEYDIMNENNSNTSKSFDKPVQYDDGIKGAVFMARNCNSLNHREEIVQQLIDNTTIFRIDSISECLHNAEPPDGVSNDDDKLDIIRHYLFYLAFENQCIPDYITEKLWQPLVAGVIPVYLGSPNIKEHVPKNSIIFVDDYFDRNDSTTISNLTSLSKFLAKVANNKELYESYHEWRKYPLPTHFHSKYDMTAVHSTCRTCRWAFARMYGFGWDHEQQTIREDLKIGTSKNACTHQNGLLYRPFQEEWRVRQNNSTTFAGSNSTESIEVDNIQRLNPMNNHDGTCDMNGVQQTIRFSHKVDGTTTSNVMQRTLNDQDGVIDMYIGRSMTEDEDNVIQSDVLPLYILRIQTLLKRSSNCTEVEPGRFRIQDEQSRLSILIWPISTIIDGTNTTSVTILHNESTFDILINAVPLRLRFITEDIDTFHTDAYLHENFFGQLMANDFFNPIEPFIFLD